MSVKLYRIKIEGYVIDQDFGGSGPEITPADWPAKTIIESMGANCTITETLVDTIEDEGDTMAEYQIVTMNGGTGDWNPPVETFEAANDAEANTHAEEHHPELEWYILDIDGANING